MERESKSYYARGRSPSRSRRRSLERWRASGPFSYSRSPSSDASPARTSHHSKYRCGSRSRTRSPTCNGRSSSDSRSRSPFSWSRSRSGSPGCDRSHTHRRHAPVYDDAYRGCRSRSRSWSHGRSRSASRSPDRGWSSYRSRSRSRTRYHSRSRSHTRRHHSPAFSGSRSRSRSPPWHLKGSVDETLDERKNLRALVSKFVDGMVSEKQKDSKGDASQLDSLADMEEVLMKKLGIPVSFDSTKGKHVADANVYAVKLPSKRKPRQYMNRKCGFNKPLPAERNR